MTMTNDFTSKIFAAFGAVAMTMTLLVSSFNSPTTATIATLLA